LGVSTLPDKNVWDIIEPEDMKGKKDKVNTVKMNYSYVFGKARKISFNLVFFPSFLLFFGLFIDKRLDTTPLFLIVGFIAGLFFAVFKGRSLWKKHLIG
jgi:F0F1-type ATP synthase assembly protein I